MHSVSKGRVLKSIAQLKLENFVYDASGKRPVTISVVMPTFNKKDKLYNKTVRNTIDCLGRLIDEGVIDEVLIAEGSKTSEGKPDYSFIEFLLACAIRASRTFEHEVSFVCSLPEGKQRALQGRYDFSFRIMSQVDPKIRSIYLDKRIMNPVELKELNEGKGANMWFSVPVTYGDIVCFIDSDIISFDEHYLKGLCRPILEGWFSGKSGGRYTSSVLFSKASYVRRRISRDEFTLGGRVSRLFGIPMFELLVKNNVFEGFEKIAYPFSGECAFLRKKLNEVRFSNGYDIEISILCQLWKDPGLGSMAQYNFGVFEHLSGDEKHAEDLLREIFPALFYWVRSYGLMKNIPDLTQLLKDYKKRALEMLDEYELLAKKIPKVTYGPEDKKADAERILRYYEILRELSGDMSSYSPRLLRSWESIKKEVGSRTGESYTDLKNVLQQRVNKFTSKTILSYIRIYVDLSDEIISRFT